MKIFKYIFSFIVAFLFQTYAFAQDTAAGSKSGIDSFMLSNGKVFVVVAVVFVIVLVLFVYMFGLDKKLSKLESKMKE